MNTGARCYPVENHKVGEVKKSFSGSVGKNKRQRKRSLHPYPCVHKLFPSISSKAKRAVAGYIISTVQDDNSFGSLPANMELDAKVVKFLENTLLNCYPVKLNE